MSRDIEARGSSGARRPAPPSHFQGAQLRRKAGPAPLNPGGAALATLSPLSCPRKRASRNRRFIGVYLGPRLRGDDNRCRCYKTKMTFDTIIRGGTVATASDTFACDVGISGGRIAALGANLGDADGDRRCDAASWCCPAASTATSISRSRPAPASSWPTISPPARARRRSAATPWCCRSPCSRRAKSLREVVKQYHAKADGQCYVDVSFHLIIADATDRVLGQELPALVERRLHLVQGVHDL